MRNQELKNEKFKRLATKRTNDVLNKIRILSNCANKSTYAYAPEEVNKIFNIIDKATKIARAKFGSSKSKEFKL
ncbi:hypothetical protein HN814_11600 [Candidatus Woesearchaeota archaeon]|jgi:hypothetical protein|nr:hypothetical protein [Candidatus Falkowbacteria bacterium]MBT7368837.1 hypothetical protein [Candidatus Woesearchaeota archaeon]